MKFDCGLTPYEKMEVRTKWHIWFAWYPVWVGHRDCRWLEKVNRKGSRVPGFEQSSIYWEYEAI